MVNLAIYVRVSSNNQTYERQVIDITNYIHKQYNATDINIDLYAEKISGLKGSNERPELTRFLEVVEKNPKFYKCLYITELSRVGRKPIDARITVTNLIDKGIDVCVTSLNGGQHFLNSDGSINQTQFSVLGLLMDFAQIEIDVFKSRAASGLKQKIFDGGVSGGLLQPYGYFKDENKKLVIDEDESKIIKYIFEQYKKGIGMGSIANQLNNNKTLTRANKAFVDKEFKGRPAINIKWTANQIYTILTNSIYCGKRIYKKKKTKAKDGKLIDNSELFYAPDIAIVSETLFNECTEIRKAKKGNGRNIHTKNVILLQYLTKCGVCGRNFTHQVSDLKQMYVCSSRVVNKVKNCSNLGVNIDLVDSTIYNMLCRAPKVLEYINDTDKIKKDIENQITSLEISIPITEKELKLNETKIDNLLELIISSEGSIRNRYQSKLKELESISDNLSVQISTKKQQLLSNTKSLKNLTKVKFDDSVLINAKNDRIKLQSIFKQIIKSVEITAINFQFIRLDIKLQINGIELDGTIKVVVSRKGLRKKPPIFQYQESYISEFDPTMQDLQDYIDYNDYINDNPKYQYKNTIELNKLLNEFTTVTDNVLSIKE